MDDFATERLTIRHWREDLADPARRKALESRLDAMLTSQVLTHLPEPLQRDGADGDIAGWMAARQAECEVYLINRTSDASLIGLLFMATHAESGKPPDVHVGYLIAEHAWGQRYATELLRGLVTACRRMQPLVLMGGVGRGNAASARVLEKVGFLPNESLSDAETQMFELRIKK